MSDIPLGICREILLRLPAESLVRFRSVSKRWRAVIDDPCFVKAHTRNQLSSNSTKFIIRISAGPPFYPLYLVDLEKLDFANGLQTIPATPLRFTRSGLSRLSSLPVAACNGLILTAFMYSRGEERVGWEIRNPLTHERLKLPKPNVGSKALCYGLGYDCANDDYKVVAIEAGKEKHRNTHVFSLKLGSWKKIQKCPCKFYPLDYHKHGVFLNGSLHWLLGDGIVAFDVVTENYRQLALPIERTSSMKLDALSGSLFLSCGGSGNIFVCQLDVWVMNDDCGRKDTWIKLFSIDRGGHSRPVAFTKNKNRVLLLCFDEFKLFDVESNSLKAVTIHGVQEMSAQVCVETLFRLRDSCAASKRKMRTTDMKMAAHTKLTFCVRDFFNFQSHNSYSHDNCYSFGSKWFDSPSVNKRISALPFDSDSASRSVPVDICREIFLHLPAKSLIRFRAVCKAYRAVIDDPSFVRAHTKKHLSSNTFLIRNSPGPPFHPLYSFNLDDLSFNGGLQKLAVTPLTFTPSGLSRLPHLVVPVCHGLMLVSDWGYNNLELWNPLTHERLELPQLGHNSSNSKRVAIGLGYDYTTDDYKAVVIKYQQQRKAHQTHVYSLRADSWSNVEKFPGDEDWQEWQSPRGIGVFLSGALHWPLHHSLYERDIIVALDLGTEKFQQLQGPPVREKLGSDLKRDLKMCLGVLGGCLTVSVYGYNDMEEFRYHDVWIMKVYGAEWVKWLSIDREVFQPFSVTTPLRAVAYLLNKTQILMEDSCFLGFYLFDIESNSMKQIGIHGLPGRLSIKMLTGSIFRLHDFCGVSGRRRRRRRNIMTREEGKMKICDTDELYFCVGDCYSNSHDSCYNLDSNCDYMSGEDEEDCDYMSGEDEEDCDYMSGEDEEDCD